MSSNLKKTVLSAMFLALALVLPFLTGQIPQIGSALCPMHLPVLLCGFFCGPLYASLIGLCAPLLRFLLFMMPPLVPTGLAMCAELFTYGLVSGLLYQKLPKTKINIYVSLITAMLAGRVAWGFVRWLISGITNVGFSFKAFAAGAVLNAVPGIILQLILIPVLVMLLQKHTNR